MAVALFDQSSLQHRAVSGAPRVFYWVRDAQLIRELGNRQMDPMGTHVHEPIAAKLSRCACFCDDYLLSNNHRQLENGNENTDNFFFLPPVRSVGVLKYKHHTESVC